MYYSFFCCNKTMHFCCSWRVQVEIVTQMTQLVFWKSSVTNNQMFRSKCISSGVPKMSWQHDSKICWEHVCVCESVHMWHDSLSHCWSFSLFASAFPPSFLCFKVSSSLPSLLLPFLYLSSFLYSCCFIWLPDLSSVISVHPLHFDVSPHTTTKTRPLLTLHLSLILALLIFFPLCNHSIPLCFSPHPVHAFCCHVFFFKWI